MKEIKSWLQGHMKGQKIPDSLTPEQMEKKLAFTEQKKGNRRFKPAVSGMIAAACLVLLIAGGALLLRNRSITDRSGSAYMDMAGEIKHQKGSGVKYADLYQSIQGYYRDLEKYGEYIEEYALNDMAGEGSTGEAQMPDSSGDFSVTDLQVSGVEEGDCIFTDGEYIYTIESKTFSKDGQNFCRLRILKPSGRKTEEVAKLKIKGGRYQNMYLDKEHQKIYVIGQRVKHNSDAEALEDDYVYDYDFSREEVVVSVVDISNREKPQVIHTWSQDGWYQNSRIADGFLYLFSVYGVPDTEELREEEPSTYVPDVDGEVIPENRIYAQEETKDHVYTVMSSMALSEPDRVYDKAAAFGSFENFYMSSSRFYLAKTIYGEEEKNLADRVLGAFMDSLGRDRNITQISKYHYEKGEFYLEAEGKIRGTVDGSYAFHEYQGYLCVVYTDRKREADEVNGLYVLDDSLSVVGEIGDLGAEEEIYASYYMDYMAYFVTYRNTDPVFAVDVSDVKHPKLCSELKLQGYSDYLHSFGENQMVGLGVHRESEDAEEETYKISLFDIDSKKVISEKDRELIGSLDTMDCYLIDDDHRAVFVDEERGLFGFGVYDGGEETGRFHYYLYQKKKGKMVFLWKTIMRLQDPANWDESNYIRGVRIKDNFYAVSVAGQVEVYALDGK